MNPRFALSILLFLSGCSGEAKKPQKELLSPNRDYLINVFESDPGSCCSSRVYASIISNSYDFPNLNEEIFDIYGGNYLEIKWKSPYNLQIKVCNAKKISFNSDFSNNVFTKHIHVNVINEIPERNGSSIICSKAKEPEAEKVSSDRP